MSEANKSTTSTPLIYDLIIIGAGPAGLTASIYASRYKLSNLVIGKALGGELSLAHNVCNFPGFIGIPGCELVEKWQKQVEELGAKILLKEVGKIEKTQNAIRQPADKTQNQNSNFKIIINEKEYFESKALIVATGSERRRLNIPGEKEYLGKGVSYCTTCDAAFFKGKTVGIIGGADAAVTGAINTADFASKVYLIYRGDKLRAEPMWLDDWHKIESQGKGETILQSNLLEVLGDGSKVTAVKLDKPYKGEITLKLDGIFVEIGGVPGTSLLETLGVKLDETGHVLVDDTMAVNIEGIFCAGDLTSKSAIFKQAIYACAQGALAASSAYKFIKKESAPRQLGI